MIGGDCGIIAASYRSHAPVDPARTAACRFQIAPAKTWRFACPACLPAEQARPGYRYGGTWKGARH
ncbi:MAG: hypothetical protein NTW01_05800 [Gammaproteobacteria bacterium]|nr:hypothetical protein [Gammaproteobacteria bacterium]